VKLKGDIFLKVCAIGFLAVLAAAIFFYVKFWPALRPAFGPVAENLKQVLPRAGNGVLLPPANDTPLPLKLPPGFAISIFAENLPGARVIERDQFGNFWISQTAEGVISLLEVKEDKVVNQYPIFKNLRRPHGLAFDPKFPGMLYFAEENKISRVPTYADGSVEKVIDLPTGDGHYTRTIGFGPDDRLYVSIGSSCNICNETDSRRAKIFVMSRDGNDFKEYARGLRNAVFFTWSYVDGRMWTTEMGRDWLGDMIPPDEINLVEEGKNYGWPTCYGKNTHDADFDQNVYIRNPCQEPFEIPSYIDLPAHSAPLGLAFIPKEGWPEEYWYDLIVALHGSWNRNEPTGYKLVRVKLDERGNYEGTEDFITGWLTKDGALGRPVDVWVEPGRPLGGESRLERAGGVMYVSDDKAGLIYKITYHGRASDQDKSNLIQLEKPEAGEIIKSPVLMEGKARGYWFFEASFPVGILDAEGKELGFGVAQAEKEWMTEEFVPFRAEVGFSAPSTDTGFLVLKKDNPSGLLEHEDKLLIPVRFR